MISCHNISVTFHKKDHDFQALSDISFHVSKGKIFGIIGESGSGKTTILNVLAGLVTPHKGSFSVNGSLQYVFQDPYSALHPYHTVGKILEEPLKINKRPIDKEKIVQVLTTVGLAEEHYFRFPHQLSGGQRQRVSIARALIMQADILLLDEPTSALDVSVQAEILNLLKELQENHGLTMILVTHDLGVASFMSDEVLVMKQGMMMEKVLIDDLRKGAITHPYTKELVNLSFSKG
jgi:peptide/nickel transport system ATP-binding protein